MKPRLLAILKCTDCDGPIELSHLSEGSESDVEYGVVSCTRCSLRYPIVAGIPILRPVGERVSVKAQTEDRTVVSGPRVSDLVDLILANRPEKALSKLVAPSTLRFHLPLLKRLLGGTVLNRGIRFLEAGIGLAMLPQWRRQTMRQLQSQNDSTTAMDALQSYYGGAYQSEMLNYFAYRFGNPRHLAALCLVSLFRDIEGPVLDLACGAGHLTHSLSYGHAERTVVALDRNFFQLLVARRFVAPQAEYVCCEADHPLPFASDSFAGVLCSDAFHCFQNSAACVEEMERITRQDGSLLLARFGNAMLGTGEGYERSPEGYKDLFSRRPNVLLGEDSLLDRYVKKLGPKLDAEPTMESLHDQKWLSAVVSKRTDLFRDHGPLDDWPHATGRLRINPLYFEEQIDEQGCRTLRLQFLSERHAYEDQDYRKYGPETVRVTAETFENIEAGERTSEVEELIRQLVVIGMPDRYM